VRVHGLAQHAQVAVLDVAAVLAQVDDDAVGAAEQRERRGGDRVGLQAEPRLPHRGDVIDIHHEPTLAHARSSPMSLRIASHSSLASCSISAASSPSIITRASGSVPE